MENTKRRWPKLILLAPLAMLAISGIAYAAMMLAPPPADLDVSLTRPSEHGLYLTTVIPDINPVTVGSMHSWTIELKTAEGHSVDKASIAVDGGMPQHGHGLPTSPVVTENLGDGRYLVEGVKFNMPGWWTVTVHVDGTAGADQTTFNVML